jgi:hypothetical protein
MKTPSLLGLLHREEIGGDEECIQERGGRCYACNWVDYELREDYDGTWEAFARKMKGGL